MLIFRDLWICFGKLCFLEHMETRGCKASCYRARKEVDVLEHEDIRLVDTGYGAFT